MELAAQDLEEPAPGDANSMRAAIPSASWTEARAARVLDLGSKGPDGRTLMQVYVDSLKSADQSMVEIKTKRPKGEVEVAKLNGLVKMR